MRSIKSFLLAGIFLNVCIPLIAVDKTIVIAKFLHKHKTLETIAGKIDDLNNHKEHQQICAIFSRHIMPLFETTTKINQSLVENNYQLNDDLLESIEQFEDRFQHYAELVGVMDSFLLQAEQIHAMQTF